MTSEDIFDVTSQVSTQAGVPAQISGSRSESVSPARQGRGRPAAPCGDLDHLETWSLKGLQEFCKTHNIKPYSNRSKDDLVGLIGSHPVFRQLREEKHNEPELEDVTVAHSVAVRARKTKHCVPRLLNIMFGEEFLQRTLSSELKSNRRELDARQTGADSRYWTDIHSAFVNGEFQSGGIKVRIGCEA